MKWRRGLVLLTFLHSGCLDGFTTPSAYSDQPYVCDDAAAWAMRSATCAATDGCGGVVNYQGQLEGNTITVDSALKATTFQVVIDQGVQILSEISATGESPYFEFTLELRSLGGRNDIIDTNGRLLELNSLAEELPDPLSDENVDMNFRLTSGGDSVGLAAITESGAITVVEQEPDRLTGTFTGSFGTSADQLKGCFDLRALEKRILEPTP